MKERKGEKEERKIKKKEVKERKKKERKYGVYAHLNKEKRGTIGKE